MRRYLIGIDAVNISRAGRLGDHFVESYFHPNEFKLAMEMTSQDRKAQYIASRFAAKEALSKAMGTGLAGMKLDEIEVRSEPSGKPVMILHGSMLESFEAKYPEGRIEISITHEDPLAIACMLIDYEEEPDGTK